MILLCRSASTILLFLAHGGLQGPDRPKRGAPMILTLVLALIFLSALLFLGYGFLSWIGAAGIWLIGWRIVGVQSPLLFEGCVIVLIVLAMIFGVPLIRRQLISRFAMKLMAPVLPRMGETERIALEAGTVWWDAELFSGRPALGKIARLQAAAADRRRAGVPRRPGQRTVRDDRRLAGHPAGRSAAEVWEFLKENGFFGMIIPQEYGGLGFSALAHSRVVDETLHAQRHRRGDGDGAQLARARRSCCCTTAPTCRSVTTCRGSRRARRFPASR